MSDINAEFMATDCGGVEGKVEEEEEEGKRERNYYRPRTTFDNAIDFTCYVRLIGSFNIRFVRK